ncbi:MAG: hypothetical protein ACRD0A_02780 [Acidimicrobiales bacterium]
MRRAVHELALLVAILILVVTTPVLAIRGLTMALGTWPGEGAPAWWDRGSVAAAGLFLIAALFLAWDTHRISRVERNGVIVEHLRVPVSRRRRRR